MAKRKLTPLQQWRRDYAELSFIIHSAKQVARGHHVWGDFKRPQAQRTAATMKVWARNYMTARPLAAAATAAKWEEDSIARAIKLGHPIPNSTAPENKVEG